MRHFLLCLLATLWIRTAAHATAPSEPEIEPTVGKERVVLSTNVGDLVLALFPDEAPATVAQVLKLVSLGVYDSTHFFKVNPDFFAQVSGTARRRLPLAAEQQAAIHPLKVELNHLRHRYGMVSMAHDAGNPDNAETSFLILLREVPEMDGKYTIFGRIESGASTLEAIRSFPASPQHEPYERIEVQKAFVVYSPEALLSLDLRGPNRAYIGLEGSFPAKGYFILALALAGLGVAAFVLLARHPRSSLATISLLFALVGFFLLFASFTPRAATTPGLGLALFVFVLGLFKLMTQFERAPS